LKKIHYFIIIFLNCFSAIAQESPLHRDFILRHDKILNRPDVSFHTSVRPYLQKDLNEVSLIDTLQKNIFLEINNPAIERFFNHNFISIKKKNLSLTADPYLELMPGYDFSENHYLHEVGLGAVINVSINRFNVNAILVRGNSRFPSFLDSIISDRNIIPGRSYAFNNNQGYYYNNFYGNISYSAGKYFDFQLGQGRNFIGDGYRSLLLSDNAYSYPYFRINTNIWKIKYTNLYTSMRDIRFSEGDRSRYYNKYGAFHFLSWDISKRLNIGFFEAIIFENRDTTGRGFTYDLNYLNPVIFYRPVEFSIGSADNVLMGLNAKYKLFNKQVLYGQVMIDEFLLRELKADVFQTILPNSSRIHGWWANKWGIQAGFKWFDFVVKNLQLQTEFNIVRPYSYTHSSVFQNYGHYNQELAHPLQANFKEAIVFLRYVHHRWLAELKFLNAQIGGDTDTYFGQNIYRSYTEIPFTHGHSIGQGNTMNLQVNDFRISYLINPKNNLQLHLGITNRRLAPQLGNIQQNNFIYAGLRTALFNYNYDR
jgi:hypothetical protein